MHDNKDILILAIETSCDETAAAVVKNGRVVLSNVVLRKLIFIKNMAELFLRLLPESI